jgi:hypothetical protein
VIKMMLDTNCVVGRAMAQARRPLFDPGSVHVGFVLDKVALGKVFPRVLRFSPVNFILPVLHYTEKHHHQSVAQEVSTLPCVLSIC